MNAPFKVLRKCTANRVPLLVEIEKKFFKITIVLSSKIYLAKSFIS